MDVALHWYSGWWWAPILGIWGKAEWIWCHDVMVEAVKPRWLYPTFTLYIYKVFEHLKMLWKSSWMWPYTNTPADGGPRFWEYGVRLSGYDAMMSWLRLLSPTACIPLSHYIYIKCLSTLRCCGKAHGCGFTLILRLTVGPDFGNMGYGWVDMMPWCHGWGC
jgi:hypothetical protein